MPKITQRSFAGGEIGPVLFARNDVSKYDIGLKTLKNGFVRVEGGVSNASGTEFVCEVKDNSKKTRVIPFSFNTEESYIIEAGQGYLRFIRDGGRIVYPPGHGQAGEIVEKATSYQEEDIFNIKYTQNADILTLCHSAHAPVELTRQDHHDWTLSDISFEPQIATPQNVSASWTGGNDGTIIKYVVTAVGEDYLEESNASSEVSVTGRSSSTWQQGEYATINFDTVTGAEEYNIYKSVNGIFGFIGSAATNTFKDINYEPDMDSTAPIHKNPFNGSGNYPSCVNYYQQRRVFANSKNKPQTSWASQTGTANNFNISRPLIASDAITINLSEREVNEIRHIVGMKKDMILLTSGGEWQVSGSDGTFSASPPPQLNPQSYYGCSHVMPLVSGSMILFIQSGGSVVRDLGYTYVSDSYDGNELSIFANHLFEGKQVVDWAYSKEPFRIAWIVMSDGSLNGLTYNRKHEVIAWHRHETDGEYESVAARREGNEDIPYFVVKRTINGQTKRYIERMKSRIISNAKDGWFVDSGLSYEGDPVSSLSGLDHLEGKEVIILADGGVIPGKIVVSGSVDLGQSASKIIVGLPKEFEMETLNFEGENTQGSKKIISSVSIKVNKSRPDFFIVGNDGTEQQLDRPLESSNDPGWLYSGDIEDVTVFSTPSTNASVRLKQKYPLPLTVLSVTAEINVANV